MCRFKMVSVLARATFLFMKMYLKNCLLFYQVHKTESLGFGFKTDIANTDGRMGA